MIEGQFYQVGYITRNLALAADRFRATADIRRESTSHTSIMVKSPDGPFLMEHKLALFWVGAVQYELIEPIGYSPLYSASLPDAEDEIRMHHIAMRVPDWDDFRARLAQQPCKIAMEGEHGTLRFMYVDARPLLGHHIEYLCCPDSVWSGMGGL